MINILVREYLEILRNILDKPVQIIHKIRKLDNGVCVFICQSCEKQGDYVYDAMYSYCTYTIFKECYECKSVIINYSKAIKLENSGIINLVGDCNTRYNKLQKINLLVMILQDRIEKRREYLIDIKLLSVIQKLANINFPLELIV